MKNKIVIGLIGAVLSSAVFAKSAVHKKEVIENNGDSNGRIVYLEKQLHGLQHQVATLEKADKKLVKADKKLASNLNLDLLVEMYAHGPAVVTSPALGVRRSAEDASDLMVNLPSINEDLVLLHVRKKMDNYAQENGIAIPERPIIAVSGSVEGRASVEHGYGTSEGTDINLSNAELDFVGEASPWATGAMIISYDDDQANNTRRLKNSRLQVDRGWVTIGQLNKFPMYFSIGQMSAPFGSFSSDMITKPLTKALGKFKDRMMTVGAYWEGLNAQIYAFNGENKGSSNVFQHTGFNLGYDYTHDKLKISVGGSIIGNFAEVDRMQDKIFSKDFSSNPNNERLSNHVYGVDGRIKINYYPFTLRAEYVGAGKRFNAEDISFNGDGAKPQAMHVEGAVEFDIKGKPNNFVLGYGHSWEALALGLPRDSLFAEYDVSLIKSTILSFEYRHDIDYGKTDVAKGRGQKQVDFASKGGRHKNTVIANLTVYF